MSNFKLVKTAAALALGASVVTSAVATTDASAASKYKIKSGKLVYAKSGKVVKGYVTYKSTVYKNGKKLTGLKGKTYYKAGKKATGTYKGAYYVKGVKKVTTGTYNKAYYVKGVKKVSTGIYNKKYYKYGKVATGTYKGAYYVKGIKKVTTGTYAGSYYVKGVKIVSTGLYQDRLYQAGKLSKGYATYKSILYKDSYQNEGLALFEGKLYDGPVLNKGLELFEGKLYNGSVLSTGFVKHDEKFYNNGELANGEFDGVEYKDGVAVKYEVTDVKAINAEELQVTFSEAVTEATAENKANYELSVNGFKTPGTSVFQDIQLSDDGKTATLRVGSGKEFKKGDKIVLQSNDAIKLAKNDKKVIAKHATDEFLFDVEVAPTLVANPTATLSNKEVTTLNLTFDRPVASTVTLIKIDGIEISSKSLTPVKTNGVELAGDYRYTVAVSVPTASQLKDISANGEHKVVIYDVKATANSLATHVAPTTGTVNTSYTIAQNTAQPEIKSVTALNSNKFFLETNRSDITLADAVIEVNKGTHTFAKGTVASTPGNNVANSSSTMNAEVGHLNGKPGIYVVVTDKATTDANPLYKDAETSAALNVSVKNLKADGLVGKDYTGSVTLNKADTKPSVYTTSYDTNNTSTLNDDKLNVVFNNKLNAAPTVSDIIVRDKDGVVITGIANVALDVATGKTVTITLPGNLSTQTAGAPYTVEFKADTIRNAKDSTIAGYSVLGAKNDKIVASVSPEDQNFGYVAFSDLTATATGANNKITIDYKKDMKDSAKDLANYKYDGVAFPAGTTIDFVGGKQQVVITLPKNSIPTTTGYKLTIDPKVETATGQKVVKDLQSKTAFEKVVSLTDNTQPTLKSGKYVLANQGDTTTKELVVAFSEDLKSTLTSTQLKDNLKVELAGVKQDPSSYNVALGSKSNEVKITFTNAVSINQEAKVTVVPDNNGDIAIQDAEANNVNYALSGSTATIAANTTELDVAAAAAQQAVNAEAAKITKAAVEAKPAFATNALTAAQSLVTAGYNVTIKSSANTNTNTAINSSTGAVTTPSYNTGDKSGNVTFTVAKDGKTADVTVNLTVAKAAIVAASVVSTPAAIVNTSGTTTFTITLVDSTGAAVTGLASTKFAFASNAAAGSSKLGTIAVAEDTTTAGKYNVTVPTTATTGTNATENLTITVDGVNLSTTPTVTIAIS
ncbi:hypothetical protein QN089_02060 [Kurthia sp. YJT4]|uniref:hypothetical protein n=1 Tax=Kurthia sp. YJT4 TaxID=3049086 RepID=UPI00254D9B55|nr:hypothetical protein [Kurthia sp. YJT4]WIL39066.1 hypothetical protein QN089_02060 [Kurthia sp. YJT4]